MAGRATIMPFVFDMPATMREADLVVARSGAVTVAELTAMGKPALLVPLPQSIYGHQAKNAAVLEAAGAAIVIPQSRLTGEALSELVLSLWSDPSRLTEMARRSRELGRTDAAESIIRDCLGLMGAAQKEAGTAG
jgi:UDP-N-acetylglucosamine--N-acetylmuramyl-(pentapeptide) pyrophosphoryl-undecaprenol N-acetylglucosamine transferase